MVSAASGHPARFVEWEMSVAEGLQYQAIWLEKEGNLTRPARGRPQAAAAMERIAGF